MDARKNKTKTQEHSVFTHSETLEVAARCTVICCDAGVLRGHEPKCLLSPVTERKLENCKCASFVHIMSAII